MTEGTGKLIAILLAGILAVLLFGRASVVDFGAKLPWIIGGLLVLWLVYLFAKGVFDAFAEDYSTESTGAGVVGKILLVITYTAFAANLLAFIWVGLLAWDTGKPLREVVLQVPLAWVPLIVGLVCYGLFILDRKRRARRASRTEDKF